MNQKTNEFNGILDFLQMYGNEQKCVELLEKIRWNGKPICFHCGNSEGIYRLQGGKLLKCSKCRKRFSVRQGTIFEESRLPLSKWYYAIYIFSNHKKGISSVQLAKDLKVTQKTAWFMLGRVRYAMKSKSFNKPLEGVIEADESYFGSKPRKGDGKIHKKGRGTEKQPVFGMIQRGGNVIAMPVEKVNATTLKGEIRKHVKKGSYILTDEWQAYQGLNRNREYGHLTVNHGAGEYEHNGVHVNNMENFWSQMKRGIFGIYHHASKKHMARYAHEFAYRHNTRGESDTQRFNTTLENINGRLTYEELIK